MSSTFAPAPIVAALDKGRRDMDLTGVWTAVNEEQETFLQQYYQQVLSDLGQFTAEELAAIASWDADDINAFLAERGFSITLDPFDEDTFGLAAALKVTVEWLVEGIEATVENGGQEYTAFRLDTDKNKLGFHRSRERTVVTIPTKTGDTVYLTMVDEGPADLDLGTTAADMMDSIADIRQPRYGGVVIPSVDLDQLVDVSWVIDMRTQTNTGLDARITQAKQQTKFKMNRKGARVESAFAAAVALASFVVPAPDLIIDRPFLIAIQRPNTSTPYFVGHLTPDDWKDPGDFIED